MADRRIMLSDQKLAKRRRSSLEHEIMRQKLTEWRTKKGLPALAKYEEEKQKMLVTPSYKKTALSQSAKRTHSCMSHLEKNPEKYSRKMRTHATPGSCKSHRHSQVYSNIRTSCSTSKKEAGGRSLPPTTSEPLSKQPLRIEKRDASHCEAKNETLLTSVGLPLANRTNQKSSITHGPMKLQEVCSTMKAKTTQIKSRKSVRFTSPQGTSEMSVKLSVQQPSRTEGDQMAVDTPASSVKPGMRERLEQWLISKGKTPSRFRNFLGYESSLAWSHRGQRPSSGTPHHAAVGRGTRSTGTPGGRGKGPVEQAGGVSGDTISGAMRECFIMLEEGCPLNYISSWLDKLVTKLPVIRLNAAYWLCRAKIAEKESGDQSALECLFEAVEFGAEPTKEIEESLAAYRLKLRLATEDSQPDSWDGGQHISSPQETGISSPFPQPQTPVAHLCFDEEEVMHQSDADKTDDSMREVEASNLSIKYSLKETTPYFARIHGTPGQASTTPCLMVTPVRRSARLDNKRRSVITLGNQPSPITLARQQECLDSVQQVVTAYPAAQLILRPNRALATEFSEELLKE